ncbi:MAG: hypothetical protein ACR2QV_05350 [Gammaproteobacteria bacterium]
MHSLRTILVTAAIALVAGACSPGDESPPKTDAEKREALENSAFGELSGTLDKAADVEKLNQDRKRQLDETLDN